MTSFVVRLQVGDFEAWKQVYDWFADMRREQGVVSSMVFRDPGDPHAAWVVHHFPTAEGAQAFARSADLQEAMRQSGVFNHQIWLLQEVERFTY
jgi:quinol monooxygenase YgiN